MTDHIFTVISQNQRYQMVLPNWETDYIQGLLAKDGEPYEHSMLQAMKAQLAADDLVLDVGANIGNHSLYLAKVAGCRVIAFEPNAELCEPFLQSIGLNALENHITLQRTGVGEAVGKAHFANYLPHNLGGQSLTVDDSEKSEIPIISLDSLNLKVKVRAIKVDVEGMELAVLKGSRELIARDMPILFVEAQTEADFEALQSVVVELGYVYWDTFNATPTHWFIHKDELGENAIIDHYFEKGRDSYKLRLDKREIQQRLNEANIKYRSANERIDELKEKLSAANEKYKIATAQGANTRDKLNAEIEQLRSKLTDYESKLKVNVALGSSEPTGVFDFSVDESEVG